MADQINFELVSPEKLLLSEPVEMVVVPGVEGDFGVLPGHAPFVSNVRPGVIAVFAESKVVQRIFVAGGFAEVTPERCTVLADEATPLEQVTAEQLVERQRTAERDLVDAATDAEKAAAQKALAVAKDLQRAQAFYAGR